MSNLQPYVGHKYLLVDTKSHVSVAIALHC